MRGESYVVLSPRGVLVLQSKVNQEGHKLVRASERTCAAQNIRGLGMYFGCPYRAVLGHLGSPKIIVATAVFGVWSQRRHGPTLYKAGSMPPPWDRATRTRRTH